MCETQHVVPTGPIQPYLGGGGRASTRLEIAKPYPFGNV
jgi:hypothetical protein